MRIKKIFSKSISASFYVITLYWCIVFAINLFLQVDLIANKKYNLNHKSVLLLISLSFMTLLFFVLFLSFLRKYIKKNTKKFFVVLLIIATFFLILFPDYWYYLGKEYILFSIHNSVDLIENNLINFITSPGLFYLLSLGIMHNQGTIRAQSGDGSMIDKEPTSW